MNDLSLLKMDDFGLWSHSIKNAAKLTAVELFFSGELNLLGGVVYGELDFVVDEEDEDPRLIEIINEQINIIEKLLINAVEKKEIVAKSIHRDFNNEIIPENTYISSETLHSWLESRGIVAGDKYILWGEQESRIGKYILNEVIYLRSIQSVSNKLLNSVLNRRLDSSRDMQDSWDKANDEINYLKNMVAELSEKKSHQSNRPLRTSERRTHQVIIAALCKKAGINPNARGAAAQIMAITEGIGAPITDDTIRKILNELPESIEFRTK